MTEFAAYEAVDAELKACSKPIKALYYIEPINEQEQKAQFLAGRTGTPSFAYRPLEYDPAAVERRLRAVHIPLANKSLAKLYREKQRDLLTDNTVIRECGVEDVVREATSALHGKPDRKLVAYAEKLLREIPSLETEKTIPSAEIQRALEAALKRYGLADWRVELADKKLTTVYADEKKITVSRNRLFAAADPVRLAVHEVGVHALRSANGYAQPLLIFATGLPGYLPTEEGMASYFEEQTGNRDGEVLRDYAGRVIVVDAVCKNLDFRETFDRIRTHGFTEDQSWNLAVRAHRGGGYIKDHVYLAGYCAVKGFAKKGGDFRTLYVGKVGIDHLPLVRELLESGVLDPASYLPEFIP